MIRRALRLLAMLAVLGAASTAHGDGDDDAAPPKKLDEKPSSENRKKGSDLVGHVSLETSGYTDNDGVTVLTPTIAATIENPLAAWSLSGRYLVDVVSAASADIVATASPPFHEVRHAGSLDGSYKFEDFGVAATTALSVEPDDVAFAAGGHVTYDLFEKNVSTLLGYSLGRNEIGRHDTPFSVFSHVVYDHDIDAAVTVVVNRSTLLALVGDVIFENGDTSKPYRHVPMFAADVAPTVSQGASVDEVNAKRLPERPLEQLPTSRDKFAFTGRVAHRFTDATFRLEERVYTDTWGSTSSTTDMTHFLDVSRRVRIWPHARLYFQTPVSFWQRAYVATRDSNGDWTVPAIRTGNRELGPLRGLTGGGGVRFAIGPDEAPTRWIVGAHGDVLWTHFLDDLYITDRISVFGSITLEAEL